jgi:type II secretory pathway predicted ATPase ExeA
MVLKYFQLAEQPFGVTPDPRFLYLSPTHREAMASVLYGVKAGRGFGALIAEPGMGKTTVLFNLLQQLGDAAKSAFLFQPHDTPRNFLRNLLLDLGIEDDGQDPVRMQAKLNECLVRETGLGKHFLVVVDEAQNLDEPVLEVVRMLSNFETPREKLMHIILAGQPALAAKLASPQLLQLRQRISIVARLAPFTAEETRAYIEHRLRVAGYRGESSLFADRAYALIAAHSGGIPRNINNLCFNALSLACAMQRKTIHADTVEEVLRDLELEPLYESSPTVAPRPPSAPPAPVGPSFLRRMNTSTPRSWMTKVGMATLAAFLVGVAFAGVTGNPHLAANSAIAATASPTGPLATAATPSMPADGPSAPASTVAPVDPKTNPESADARLATGANGGPSGASSGLPGVHAADFEVVHVERQDTLYQICMDHFGRYDQDVIAMIRELNPGFEGPRRLHPGQDLRIPTLNSLEARTNLSPERLGNTSAAEAKKP